MQSDPLLLHQVFLNIVMNAEQAIMEGGGDGRIEIETKVAPTGDRIITTVRDTGPGIPDDALSRIFEPFYTTKEVGKGTGLGLAIAYGIVQEHGGQIVATNHPEGGAVFTVDLPAIALPIMIDETFLTTEEVLEYLQVNLRTVYRLIKAGKIPAVRVGRQWRFRKRDIDAWLDSQRPAARALAAAPARSTVNAGRQRVLVVDDEASIRDLLSKTLTSDEYDVDVAPDGHSALERLRSCSYDLLIVDLKMPGMDGLTVIREARRYKADLPVIIITGFSTESSAIDAVNLGVAGYLTKPFRVPQVLAAAAKALGE